MSVTINLPESWKEFINSEVEAGGHGTVENYVQALLLEDQKRKARERIEAMLEEGLDCPEEREWGPAVLDELKRELRADTHPSISERQ